MTEMNITLDKFNESFNFAFGVTGLPDGFDTMNNPYYEFLAGDYRDFLYDYRYEVERCS